MQSSALQAEPGCLFSILTTKKLIKQDTDKINIAYYKMRMRQETIWMCTIIWHVGTYHLVYSGFSKSGVSVVWIQMIVLSNIASYFRENKETLLK